MAVAADGLSGNPDHHGAARDLLDHHGVGPDPAVVADLDRAEDLGAGADDHAVSDGGVAFPGIAAGAAERDAVINRDVVADLRGFADHHAGRVVNEHAGAENGPGMDVDPGQDAGDLPDRARGHLRATFPQPVADPVSPDGVHARVGEDDLQGAGDGGIALLRRPYVVPDGREHG